MAEEEKKKDQKEDSKATSKAIPKINLKVILTVSFLVLNGVLVISGASLAYLSTLAHIKPAMKETDIQSQILESREGEPFESLIYTMETFNTNLDGIPRRLIQLQVNLDMLDEGGFEEIVSLEAKARDSIMHILNAKTFSEIESIQGKLHLKNQIINRLNQFLQKGIVKGVYFSDLVVQ